MKSHRDAERLVRKALTSEFQTDFSEKRMPLGKTLSGEDAQKRFDAVSENCEIVVMVKDYSAANKTGNRTRLARVSHDLLLLHTVDANYKFMYLSKPFYEWFKDIYDAVVPNDVVVRTIPT